MPRCRGPSVVVAVMPRGVEHAGTPHTDAPVQVVVVAVMPRGVEHSETIGDLIATPDVVVAVMPRGVEHLGSMNRVRRVMWSSSL